MASKHDVMKTGGLKFDKRQFFYACSKALNPKLRFLKSVYN